MSIFKTIMKRVVKALFSTVIILGVSLVALISSVISALFSSGKRWYALMVSYDQTANVLLGGSEDETISARCYVNNYREPYKTLEKVVDFIFKITDNQDEHCKAAFLSEKDKLKHRKQSYKDKYDELHK